MSNYLKTKSDAVKMFREKGNAMPLWTIFELGKRNPVFSNMEVSDEIKSVKLFSEALADLYPAKIYTVKMYKDLSTRRGGQKFIVPNFEFSFQFDRSEIPAVNDAAVGSHSPLHYASRAVEPPPVSVSPYAVDMSQRINLSDHVALISAKARAESDCQYYLGVIADLKKDKADLERKLDELESELDELESELDAMEEKAEEEEKARISGNEAVTMESAIASVIKENGGVLLENLLGAKGVKGAPNFSEENSLGDGMGESEEQLKDNQAVNGIPVGTTNLMSLPLTTLNEEMMSLDNKWKQHLCKIILIGQQKPETFKMFMLRLEQF